MRHFRGCFFCCTVRTCGPIVPLTHTAGRAFEPHQPVINDTTTNHPTEPQPSDSSNHPTEPQPSHSTTNYPTVSSSMPCSSIRGHARLHTHRHADRSLLYLHGMWDVHPLWQCGCTCTEYGTFTLCGIAPDPVEAVGAYSQRQTTLKRLQLRFCGLARRLV